MKRCRSCRLKIRVRMTARIRRSFRPPLRKRSGVLTTFPPICLRRLNKARGAEGCRTTIRLPRILMQALQQVVPTPPLQRVQTHRRPQKPRTYRGKTRSPRRMRLAPTRLATRQPSLADRADKRIRRGIHPGTSRRPTKCPARLRVIVPRPRTLTCLQRCRHQQCGDRARRVRRWNWGRQRPAVSPLTKPGPSRSRQRCPRRRWQRMGRAFRH